MITSNAPIGPDVVRRPVQDQRSVFGSISCFIQEHLTSSAVRMLRFTSASVLVPFLLFVLLLSAPAYGQVGRSTVLHRPRNEDRLIRFGIGISLNIMDFRVLNTGNMVYDDKGTMHQYYATTNGLHPGFNVNALMRVRFTDNMHLRFMPGICFGNRDVTYYGELPSNQGQEVIKIQFESSYIEMPILYFISAHRHNNARPYIVAGINPRLDLSAFKQLKIEHNQLLRLQKFDLAYEIGFGYEFYFPYFKMAPEIKWSGGFLNALANEYAEGAEGYRGAVKSLTSQVFVFSLIFE